MNAFWIQAIGLGMLFQGAMILWVGGFPKTLRGQEMKVFWLEQYSYIGLVLAVVGVTTFAGGTFL